MNNNEEKIIKYCVIILIVIVTIIAILCITMIDFSGKDAEEEIKSSEVTNNVSTNTNISKKITRVEKNIPSEENTNEKDIENPLYDLIIAEGGNQLYVTEDRITFYIEENTGIIYFQFDENNNFEGMYMEIYCEDYSQIPLYIDQFRGTVVEDTIVVEGKTIKLEYPFPDEIKQMTREEIEDNLSKKYVLNR